MKLTSRRGVISLLGVLSLTGGALMLNGSGAGAAAPKISDRCPALSASLATMKGKVSNCRSDVEHVGDATETNGSGTVTLSGATATITWNAPYEGSTTANPAKTVANLSFSPPNPDEPETKMCPTGTTEQNVTGTITADTTDPAGTTDTDVNGMVVGEVCANPATGTLTLEPGSVLAFLDPRGG